MLFSIGFTTNQVTARVLSHYWREAQPVSDTVFHIFHDNFATFSDITMVSYRYLSSQSDLPAHH